MAACGAACFSAAGPKQNGSFGPQMAKNGCLTYRNSKYNLYYFLKFPLPGRPPRPAPPRRPGPPRPRDPRPGLSAQLLVMGILGGGGEREARLNLLSYPVLALTS